MADETNTVLKHFQIFRNASIATYDNYASALGAAKTAWAPTFATNKGLKDGEFVLFNYRLTGSEKVESILGIVRSGAIDIIGSYDQLTAEYKAYVDSAINSLDAADVAVAEGITGLDANNVQDALAELQGDINYLNAIDPVVTTVAAGTGISVTPSATTEGGNDVTYTVAADFTVDTIKYGSDAGNKAGKTYIRIMDGETIISETDAAAFVKDGFLQNVELIEASEGQENVLRFTWNNDAGSQVTDIKVSELCDVYNVGAGLVASADGYTFSHQAGAEGLTANIGFGSGLADTNKITVKVPSVTVDEFGHVSALTETEVSLEIPASVASAVQNVNGDTYVSATKNGTDVTLATKTKAVADATADADGLATAHSVKTYVDDKIDRKIDTLDANVTSAEGTNVRVQVVETDGKITAVNVTDNSINATNLSEAINELDGSATIASVAEGVVTLNAGIVEKDGIINNSTDAGITLAKVATTGAAADVAIADAGNLYTVDNVEAALVEVMTKANALQAAQLSAGKGIEIGTDNKINANFDIAIETRTGENAGEYIVIKDGENVIAEVNANAFVKDGFLASVTKDATTNELVFTWNTDAEAGENNQVTRIAISDLCDVYTADETYLHLNGYKFEHITKTGLPTDSKGSVVFSQTTTDSVINAAEDSVEIKVPTITVDAAGHVTALTETIVGISLPASIATAVQKINGHEMNNSFITTTVTPSDNNTTQTITVTAHIGSIADEKEGLAEATEVKAFVKSAILNLDGSATIASVAEGVVTLNAGIVEEDGRIANSDAAGITLAKVATTGAAANVSIADTGNKIVAENVEGALVELATAIDILEAVDTWDAGTY